MKGPLIRFWRDAGGAAAVEMALVAPVLLGLVLASYALWDSASRRQDERSALNAGAQYYMNGGNDDTVASQTILSAWLARPTDSSLNLTRNCMCETTPLACTSLCSNGAAPAVYVNMQLTANQPTALASPQTLESRVVRVR